MQDDLIEESIDMAMDVVSDELRGTNLKARLACTWLRRPRFVRTGDI